MATAFFSIPDIYFGDHSLRFLAKLSQHKVAIVTDAFMASSGKTQELIQAMPDARVAVFSEVTPDPSVDVLKAGVKQLQHFHPDTIIALGGGSSLDAAKGIKVTLEDYDQSQKIELIAIPTTSGSGSEVTSYAIISDPANGHKYPLISKELVPDCAILDPQLVMSVPTHVSMDTGMDVLTHAIEAIVSTGANDFSDALAQKAIALTTLNLPLIFQNPQDIAAREHMHNASCMAGMAFNSAGLGLVHAMAHAIGGMLHIAHGRANAMLLALVIEFNAKDNNAKTLANYHRCAQMMGIKEDSDTAAIAAMVRMIRFFNQRFGIASTLIEMGKNSAELEALRPSIVAAAQNDRCLASNPRSVGESELSELFNRVAGLSG